MKSIWKDTIIEIETIENSVSYKIELERDGEREIIYAGKAFKFPLEDRVKININKVCQNYLNSNLEEFLTIYVNENRIVEDYILTNAVLNFVITNLETGVEQQIRFINNWNFKDTSDIDDNQVFPMDEFINSKYVPGMLCLTTVYTPNKGAVVNDDPAEYTELGCGNYALYYQNLRGGWNSFLIEGRVNRKEDIERYNYNRSFDNTTIEFEKGSYIASIKTKWTVNTGLLSDKQSEILCDNLLSSNKVYLHDLVNNKIIPVNITDSSFQYKRNTTKEAVYYTINLENSQSRTRI